MSQIEKVVLVESKVDDLWGLYADLRRAGVAVRNVANDARGTYVYLEMTEEKNPAPIVDAWVGRPAPKRNRIVRDIRVKELKKLQEEEKKRQQEEEKKRLLTEQDSQQKVDEELLTGQKTLAEINSPSDDQPKPGFLKNLFRKFF